MMDSDSLLKETTTVFVTLIFTIKSLLVVLLFFDWIEQISKLIFIIKGQTIIKS